MATIFSYIRFSSKRQEQGDSVRRQRSMAEAWLKRHPEHTLDQTLRLRDLGVSAFTGANLDRETGDLGKFVYLATLPNSPIPKGSILMLENLDRFSRQPPRKAYNVFCELVEAGINVLTLDPEDMFTEENIDNMDSTLTVIIKMQLNYERSKRQSGMIGKHWIHKREEAQTGKPISSVCPTWLTWNEKAGCFKVKAEAKKALLYIFTKTTEGIGQKQITYYLNDHFKPIGRAKVWHVSFVGWVIRNRQVLGEFQPCTHNEQGERIPDPASPPIKGYYPQVIPDELFYRANAIRTTRTKQTGPSREFVNLFTGLVWGKDGYPCHIKSDRATTTYTYWKKRKYPPKKRATPYIRRAFLSLGHKVGKPDACPYSVPYTLVEPLILLAINEIKSADLAPLAVDDGALNKKLSELQGIENRIADLEEALTNLKQKKPLPQVVKAIAEMEGKRQDTLLAIDRLKQAEATRKAKPLEQAKGLVDVLKEGTAEEQRTKRLKLRGLLASLIERIELDPFKHDGRVGSKIAITMKAGGLRLAFSTDDITTDRQGAEVVVVNPPYDKAEKKRKSK